MKQLFLLGFFLMQVLAMHATVVTFAAPEGFRLSEVELDGSPLSGIGNGAAQAVTFTADLEPGEHGMKASLIMTSSGNETACGALQTFAVGDVPMTVTYALSNFAKIRVTVADDLGKPFPGVDVVFENYSAFQGVFTTDANGRAEAYVSPEFGEEYHYYLAVPNYASLSEAFLLENTEQNLHISFEGYHRLKLNVKGIDGENPECRVDVHTMGSSTERPYMVVSRLVSPDESDAYIALPDGDYYCCVDYEYDDKSHHHAVAYLKQRIQGGAADFEVDMRKCQPVSVMWPNRMPVTFVAPVFNGIPEHFMHCDSPTELYPGDYVEFMSVAGLMGKDVQSYFSKLITVADKSVLLNVSLSDFHLARFELSSDYDGLSSTVSLFSKNEKENAMGKEDTENTNPVYYCGSFDYQVSALKLYGQDYKCPFGPRGSFSITDADLTIPVHVSGMQLFQVYLDNMTAISQVYLTNEQGETAWLSFINFGEGLALPAGTYKIKCFGERDKPLVGTLIVPTNCPSVLMPEISEVPVGIEAVQDIPELSVSEVSGGLRIVAPCGVSVNVELFDLSGRCVGKTTGGSNGQMISTVQLCKSIYVARLSAGSAVRTVKFVVR